MVSRCYVDVMSMLEHDTAHLVGFGVAAVGAADDGENFGIEV
jgi:hypothetical protein